MADLEDAWRARAVAYTPLNSVIGGRFYGVRLPQKPTLPACAYLRAGTVPHHTGGSGSALRVARMRVLVFGSTYDSAKDTAVLVRAAFHRWGGTSATVVVQQAFLDTEFDLDYDPTTEQYAVGLDFRVWYLEP